MPPPITSDGQVTYADGNPAPTVDQMAKDVSAFLLWTAEPNLQGRHKSGWAVLIFLIVRDDPGLSQLSQHLGRGEAQGGAGWTAGSDEQGQADPRQQEGGDRRIGVHVWPASMTI